MSAKDGKQFSETPLEDHSVGHAGLYVTDESDTPEDKYRKVANTLGVISETITADIALGLDKGGKTLIDCETGIKAFVKDHLAGTKDNPVDNHLPNTETGVWIYYLTQGIERDFGRTWETTPKSLREKLSKEAKAAASGKRVITKKEKNELIAKKDMGYWLPMVSAGKMTIEEATQEVVKATQRILELEEMGIILSENKTSGVKDFNSDRTILEDWDGNWEALDIYKKKGISVVIPDIIDNFFLSTSKPKASYYNMVSKTLLAPAAFSIAAKYNIKGMGRPGAVYNPDSPQKGGVESSTIENADDFWKLLPDLHKKITTGDNAGYEIKGIHLATMKGFGKDPIIIVDGLDIRTGTRKFFTDNVGVIGSFADDVWYNA